MAEQLKMIQVFKSTHKQCKKQADSKGVSMRAYIQELLDKDKEK